MSAFSVAIPASPFLMQRMAGLSGIARCVILADLAGARSIYVVSPVCLARDWERSFEVRDRPLPELAGVAQFEDIPACAAERLIVLPADRLLTLEGMCHLRDSPGEVALSSTDHALDTGSPGEVTRSIFAGSRKHNETWVMRNINRPISFRISAFLLHRWDISPNSITWFGLALAMAMSVILAHGGPLWLATGGALYQAVMLADCVDGDIARLTYTTSRFGAALDTGFDMLANLAFVVGLMIGLVQTYGSGQLGVAAAMAGVAVLCMVSMTLLVRLGPRHGSFDVLRPALAVRLARWPRPMAAVLVFERLFKREFYSLLAASLCVIGLAWLVPVLGLGGVCIWLLAILWCGPIIVADKAGELLPKHLKPR